MSKVAVASAVLCLLLLLHQLAVEADQMVTYNIYIYISSIYLKHIIYVLYQVLRNVCLLMYVSMVDAESDGRILS